MRDKRKITFAIVTLILGLMLAIQFQTIRNPVVRDTRDSWELKEELIKQQKIQQELMVEINETRAIIQKYEGSSGQSKVEALMQEKNKLREKIGLTELKGPGVVLIIEPFMNDLLLGQEAESISPGLLSRLINELNKYKANAITVSNERIISTSPIRDVNGRTYVNNSPLPTLPIKIKVLSDDPKQLQSQLSTSQIVEEFAIENLQLSSEYKDEIVLPAYDDTLRIKFMKPLKTKTTEKG